MKTLFTIIYGILIGLLVGGGIWLVTSRPRGESVVLLSTTTPGSVTVYVTGAVVAPGVYTLPEGSRLDAAVQAAGGFLPGAEQENINLASRLEDGEKVDVPGIVDTSHVNAGRVNINTAPVSDLDALPSIGLTTAQAIVEYRLEHGPFLSIQDIQKVPGIGPATYDRIKDYIIVGS